MTSREIIELLTGGTTLFAIELEGEVARLVFCVRQRILLLERQHLETYARLGGDVLPFRQNRKKSFVAPLCNRHGVNAQTCRRCSVQARRIVRLVGTCP